MTQAAIRHRYVVFVLAAVVGCIPVVTAACGNDHAKPSNTAAPTKKRVERVAAAEPVLTANGEVLESDETVNGLVLPRGLTRITSDKTESTYSTQVPLKAMREYFSKRLFTSRVNEIGAGAVFRDATPHGADRQNIRLEVSVLPSSSSPCWVRIKLLPPVNPQPMTESQIREALERDRKRLD